MTTTTSDWPTANTQHGLLVAFGEFLQQHGLIESLMQVPIPQKTRQFSPQTKLVEFLAGIMSGIEHLEDLNEGSHPLATLVATLGYEIESLPGDFVLVLDDYHTITGEAVSDLLATLAKHWPRPLHLVLITRHNPALPIASLRAKGQLAEIRARDLRFTAEEVGQYVSHVLEKSLSQPVLERLERQTEGWIAGLYLATLALRQAGVRDSQSALAEADANTADYLMDDVLAHQPPDILQFLLRTSILDRWCVPLCEKIVGASSTDRSVRACLEWLELTNFFIIPLDDGQEWYRYHHLLREVMQRRAQVTLGLDQIICLHREAAWFEQQG